MKYNYIFFLPDNDFYKISYSDLNKLDNVHAYFGYKPINRVLYPVFKLHWAKKINNITNVPLKSIWYDLLYRTDFSVARPICFFFMAADMEDDNICNFVGYLQKKHPDAKFVAYYADLVKAPHRKRLSNPDYLRDKFDAILSYDSSDAELYGLGYYPTSFSDIKMNGENDFESDVYFLGKAKDRFEKIIDVYDKLRARGLNCLFYITGVPKEKRSELPGVRYIDSMPYEENLQHVARTKCILELQQGSARGYTLRTWEAINFDKILITNNEYIRNSKYYNKDYVIMEEELDETDLKSIISQEAHVNKLKDVIRPQKLVEYLEGIFD